MSSMLLQNISYQSFFILNHKFCWISHSFSSSIDSAEHDNLFLVLFADALLEVILLQVQVEMDGILKINGYAENLKHFKRFFFR